MLPRIVRLNFWELHNTDNQTAHYYNTSNTYPTNEQKLIPTPQQHVDRHRLHQTRTNLHKEISHHDTNVHVIIHHKTTKPTGSTVQLTTALIHSLTQPPMSKWKTINPTMLTLRWNRIKRVSTCTHIKAVMPFSSWMLSVKD